MKHSRFYSLFCIFLAGTTAFAVAPACRQNTAEPSTPQATGVKPAPMNMRQPVPEGKVTKVEDNKKICMITNKAYDKDQIPVRVNGKTYYGCCDMCKAMLTNNAGQRMAVDPVSKKTVDKSQAVIGVTANGGVIYFQNDKDLEAYNVKLGDSSSSR